MARKRALPFDPIDEASRQWGRRWGAVEQMRAVTSLMRAQQIVINELDEILRKHGLTFARFEALVLLTFSRRGSLPLGKMGERLQVHPTSVTSIVDRLEAAGLVVRGPVAGDRRRVGIRLTDQGRRLLRSTRRLRTAWLAERMRRLSEEQLAALEAALAPLALLTRDERPA